MSRTLRKWTLWTMEFWLSRFVVGARKQDGSGYPAKSLYYLVCGLLRLLQNKEIYSMNFLDEKDIRFANFNKKYWIAG